jgi:hypothetical protein
MQEKIEAIDIALILDRHGINQCQIMGHRIVLQFNVVMRDCKILSVFFGEAVKQA